MNFDKLTVLFSLLADFRALYHLAASLLFGDCLLRFLIKFSLHAPIALINSKFAFHKAQGLEHKIFYSITYSDCFVFNGISKNGW